MSWRRSDTLPGEGAGGGVTLSHCLGANCSSVQIRRLLSDRLIHWIRRVSGLLDPLDPLCLTSPRNHPLLPPAPLEFSPLYSPEDSFMDSNHPSKSPDPRTVGEPCFVSLAKQNKRRSALWCWSAPRSAHYAHYSPAIETAGGVPRLHTRSHSRRLMDGSLFIMASHSGG